MCDDHAPLTITSPKLSRKSDDNRFWFPKSIRNKMIIDS
jgi:hypothetical protein